MACMVGFHDPGGFDAITQYAFFLFHHEPHDDCSDLGAKDATKFRGAASEYVAASRNIVDRFPSPPPKYDFQFLAGPSAPDGKQGWIEAFSQDDYFTGKPRPIAL